MQDRAGSRPFAEVLDTLRASSLDGAFAHIEQQPAAAASLAQVGRELGLDPRRACPACSGWG